MKIDLHIERLILDSLAIDPGQRADVQAAVEAELARLLMTGGLNTGLLADGAAPSLRGAAIQMTNESNGAHLGTQIAQSVYSGLGAEGPKREGKGPSR
jgi:hypothetical protein